MKDARDEHDIKRPEVRSRLLQDAAAPPGPDVANVWQFGTPCASFCDFAFLNAGTRTSPRTAASCSAPAAR
eukprot:11183585-Heterocapsa_arctica.AAC.1